MYNKGIDRFTKQEVVVARQLRDCKLMRCIAELGTGGEALVISRSSPS
jgi:hypothetical protein